MRKKTILPLLAVFLCTACLSASDKLPAGGWLWKISGNGLEKPSYLFGTYHGTFDILYEYVDSIPGFHQAFDACSQCITEIVDSDKKEAVSSVLSGLNIKMPHDTTYADLLDKAQYHFLDSITQQILQAPLNQVHIRPNLLSILLPQLEERKQLAEAGYSESRIDSLGAHVMDIMLQTKAKEKNQLSAGLETPLQQMEMVLEILGTDLKEQAARLVAGWQLAQEEQAKNPAGKGELAEIYRSQDIQRLTAFEVRIDSISRNYSELVASYRYIQEKLIRERNRNWADTLPALIQDRPSFIAVGVRHLPGENGLISLFRKKGYRVEAVR